LAAQLIVLLLPSRFSPLPISAITGTGTGELLDMVCSELSNFEELDGVEEDGNYIPAIAIVGRPNVGKSSILNALVGEDRTIVSPVSGTTRDAIDTEFTTEDGQKYKLIDTAGIRRRAAVASAGSTTETLSVKRAFRAIRRSDVVALVVEAMACITEQVSLPHHMHMCTPKQFKEMLSYQSFLTW
jgi:small GTP-binding protein